MVCNFIDRYVTYEWDQVGINIQSKNQNVSDI